jgi:hypothetical protein
MSQNNDEVEYEFFKNHPADGSNAPLLGRSNRNRLNESFNNQGNPSTIEGYSNIIAARFQSVLDANSIGESEAASLSPAQKDLAHSRVVYGFERVQMDYDDAPNWNAVENALSNGRNGSGNPESPWVPNGNSPEGSTNFSDIPPVEESNLKEPSDTPFVGEGHILDPSTSSSKISKQSLLKRKILGRSSSV